MFLNSLQAVSVVLKFFTLPFSLLLTIFLIVLKSALLKFVTLLILGGIAFYYDTKPYCPMIAVTQCSSIL